MKNCFFKILRVLCLLGVISFPFVSNYAFESFHGDENLWIKTSYYFEILFLDHDLDDPRWNAWRTLDQPPVGRYIIGLALFLNGGRERFREIDKIPAWEYGSNFQKNQEKGSVPPPHLLLPARFMMALFGIGTCLLIFFIGKAVCGPTVGVLSSIFLAYNPLMLRSCSRAMTDSPLLFFMTLTIALLIILFEIKKKSKKAALFVSFPIGIAISLAAGTKLNGALSGLIVGAFLLEIMCFDLKNALMTCLVLIVVLVTSVSFFVLYSPRMYAEPFSVALDMIEFRKETANKQRQIPGLKPLWTWDEKVRSVFRASLLDEKVLPLKRVSHLPIELIFFLGGVMILALREWTQIRRTQSPSAGSILLCWTFLTYAGTIMWIPWQADRYFLPVFPCVAVLSSFGFCSFLRAFFQARLYLLKK